MVTQATPKMTFALFCATKMDVRNLGLTFEETSMLIGMAKNGKVSEIISYLEKKGGVSNGEVKPKVNWQEIYDKAHNAGMESVSKLKVIPMVVTGHANPLDDNSEVTESYYVADGTCGLCSIRFAGNTSFGKWAKSKGLASKSYDKGLYIYVGMFNQSYQKKSAYGNAFAKVLNENGIKAYADSRLD